MADGAMSEAMAAVMAAVMVATRGESTPRGVPSKPTTSSPQLSKPCDMAKKRHRRDSKVMIE
jgi:hypothetical protein